MANRRSKSWLSLKNRVLTRSFSLAIPESLRAPVAIELIESLSIPEQRETISGTRVGGEILEQYHSLGEYVDRFRKARREISTLSPRNIVVGAGGTSWDGWVSFEHEMLDISKREDWEVLFDPRSLDRILMEHVLEHLDEGECDVALALCQEYLRPNGLLRIAVPDGYRCDEKYRVEVGPPKDGHRMLFNKDSLSIMLQKHHFQVELLEYFDENENFHAREWEVSDGIVRRSVRFDKQVEFQRGELFYTSLIVDARKKSNNNMH